MRTTLDIAAPVLKQLKQLRKREGGSLSSLASRLLAQALAGSGRREVTPFEWAKRPMRATVDLADKEAVYSILDQADRAAEP